MFQTCVGNACIGASPGARNQISVRSNTRSDITTAVRRPQEALMATISLPAPATRRAPRAAVRPSYDRTLVLERPVATPTPTSPVRLTRRGRRLARTAVIAFALLLALTIGVLGRGTPVQAGDAPAQVATSTVIVEPGQSLWDVAGGPVPRRRSARDRRADPGAQRTIPAARAARCAPARSSSSRWRAQAHEGHHRRPRRRRLRPPRPTQHRLRAARVARRLLLPSSSSTMRPTRSRSSPTTTASTPASARRDALPLICVHTPVYRRLGTYRRSISADVGVRRRRNPFSVRRSRGRRTGQTRRSVTARCSGSVRSRSDSKPLARTSRPRRGAPRGHDGNEISFP